MDNTDFHILKILQEKARIPNVEVARKVGMAPSAVLERIKKLEASGVIQGYEVRLNPEMFECALIVFIKIFLESPGNTANAGTQLSEIEQVQEIHHLAGEDCLLLKLRVSDHKQLETILQTRIAPFDFIRKIKTLIALSTYKETSKIKLP